MSYKILIASKAQNDIDSILDYLILFGKQPARSFINAINKQIDILSTGKIDYSLSRFDELAKLGYHSEFFNNYVLLYYEERDKRIIAHVFHQSQNYAALV